VRNDCGRRRQGARHGQAAGAAIIDADFTLGAFGGGRRLIRAAAMAENAAGLRESFGGNLGGAKACYETRKRNRISRGKRDDAARQ
jgi:hypothetical protein